MQISSIASMWEDAIVIRIRMLTMRFLSRYRANITMSDRMPAVLAQGMGDQMYIAKFSEKDQMEAFLQYVIA